ncbi:MAG: 1-(5-phosphoribosyl)-5-[(5-phosphoribosylamino)methylideneamino]imidazole-4-carboxamide isomerase [Oscillospiraceae bacterium]|jgi:phosphoribosylformimino-5-aminoimidazole carboxamide ribotide isomerase|nr:1-(5-phosphoribosyl)-5-[(5-phosphoribosylamino)methylideneamino]imidazole-4-carboxamide isomerase [Oscillospiraceae bacterium]
MIILPAIDIKDGKCVRLYKGKFYTAQQVAENYLTTAKSFEQTGAEWIHTVDLDGAKNGEPINDEIFIDIAKNTNLKVEVGGGIRTMNTIEYYLSNGISRVILGSVALSNKQLVVEAVKAYGEKIAVGIDAKHETVRASGWLEKSDINYIDLAKEMEQLGVKYIIYTDISKDGTLEGLNLEHLDKISKAVSCNIIASGGVKDINDIIACKGLYGVICGKSIYNGSLNLAEALKYAC